jgi:hypothetical protein
MELCVHVDSSPSLFPRCVVGGGLCFFFGGRLKTEVVKKHTQVLYMSSNNRNLDFIHRLGSLGFLHAFLSSRSVERNAMKEEVKTERKTSEEVSNFE